MATEQPKRHPAFHGERPEAIDHLNPPAPPEAPKPTVRKADHFSYERPEAIDVHNPPKAKPATEGE